MSDRVRVTPPRRRARLAAGAVDAAGRIAGTVHACLLMLLAAFARVLFGPGGANRAGMACAAVILAVMAAGAFLLAVTAGRQLAGALTGIPDLDVIAKTTVVVPGVVGEAR